MFLHDAIQLVLKTNKPPLTSWEIAKIINTQKLYIRKDKQPVTATQIMARIANYDTLFLKKGEEIGLRSYNELDFLEEEILTNLWRFFDGLRGNYSNDFNRSNVILELILTSLVELERSFENPKFKEIQNELGLPPFIIKKIFDSKKEKEIFTQLITLIQKFPDRIRIVQKIISQIYKYLKPESGFFLPEYLGNILGKLKIYDPAARLLSTQNILNNFLLPAYQQNNQIQIDNYQLELWRNDQILNLNNLILESCHITNGHQSKEDSKPIAIVAPPWNIRDKHAEWSSNFSFLSGQYGTTDFKQDIWRLLNKCLLIVPERALYNGGKDLAARRTITHNNHIDAIFNIPLRTEYTVFKSIALIILDFQRSRDNNNILMADFTLDEEFDVINGWPEISQLYNQKKVIKDLSTIIHVEDVWNSNCNWNPKNFVFTPESISLKSNHQLFRLKDLLINWRKGRKVARKFLYVGGEIKYIRIKDLSSDNSFLKPGQNTLGVDFEQLERPLEPVNNSIISSLIGKKLKVAVAPNNSPYLFDSNLAVLEVDKTKVLPEFLAYELRQDYIQKRFTYLSKGNTIPYWTIKDFIELEVQIPSIEIQKDILLESNRITHLSGSISSSSDVRASLSVQSSSIDPKSILHNYLGIIKHTMKQPLATLSEDISNIKDYLKRKSQDGILDLNDFIVDLLPGELEAENKESRLGNVLKRLERAIRDAHWRFEQSENLLKIETSEVHLKKENIREFLIAQMQNYPDIKSNIKGESVYSLIDKNLFSILIDNLVDNARKHGFKESGNRKIWFKIQSVKSPEGIDEIIIDYMNNGQPLSSDFNIDNFVDNGKTFNKTIGEGFGGYLISTILRKHEAEIKFIRDVQNNLEANVHFIITLKAI